MNHQKTHLWFQEYHTPHTGLFFRVEKTLYCGKSDYQEIVVLESTEFGRVLLLDGLVMLTERDEFIYHEMLVHPALSLLTHPDRVLIIGGGDGGALREVLKHPVRQVDLVDIDGEVIRVSQEFFPWAKSAFSDPRTSVFVEDGVSFVAGQKPKTYQAILVDSTDPVGPAKALFEKSFFEAIRSILAPDGILTLQSESWFYHLNILKRTYTALKGLFTHVRPYWAPTPTYPGGSWCFLFASDAYNPEKSPCRSNFQSRYFNPRIQRAAFVLPEFLKKALGV